MGVLILVVTGVGPFAPFNVMDNMVKVHHLRWCISIVFPATFDDTRG